MFVCTYSYIILDCVCVCLFVCACVCVCVCVCTCVHAYMVLLLSIGVLLHFEPVKLPDNVWVVLNEKLLHGQDIYIIIICKAPPTQVEASTIITKVQRSGPPEA